MTTGLTIFDKIISDRGSRYAVSGGNARTTQDVADYLIQLRKISKFAKATHHSWAGILSREPAFSDDGEKGAGGLILQMIQRAELTDHVIIVTRWYGGRHLGGERFRHVAESVRHYLAETDRVRALE